MGLFDRRHRPVQFNDDTRERLVIKNELDTHVKHYGFKLGPFLWLMRCIFNAASFSVHVFFRGRIGLSTYSLITIVFAYFWIRLFCYADFIFLPLSEDFTYYAREDPTAQNIRLDELYRPAYEVLYWLKQLFLNFKQYGRTLYPIPVGGSNYTFIYSFIVVLLGLFNFAQTFFKGQHHLNRGDSVFFSWMYQNKKDISNVAVRRRTAHLIIEPLFVIALGIAFFNLTNERGFGMFLIISGVAFYFKEFQNYKAEITGPGGLDDPQF